MCSIPSTKQKRKIKNQFEVLSIPCYNAEKDYSRGAKHGASQDQHDHFKARDSTRNALKKKYVSITDRWHRDELCRNSPIAIGWTEEHCQYLIRLCQLISHTQLQEKSVEDVRTNSGRQWSMTEAGTNDDQGRFPTSSSPPQRFETASGRAESVHSENICDYDNVQLKKKRSWNVNGKVVWSWFYLLLNMMDATRMARNKDKDPRCSNGGPLQNERTICDLSRSFVAGKSDSLVGDGV